MPDPRCQLTAQELTYAATALRAEANRAARQATDPQFESSRALFEEAAKVYGDLADKLTRIAEAVGATAADEITVRQPRSRLAPGRQR